MICMTLAFDSASTIHSPPLGVACGSMRREPAINTTFCSDQPIQYALEDVLPEVRRIRTCQ